MKIRPLLAGILALVLCGALAEVAASNQPAAQQQTPVPAAGLKKLEVLAGVWKSDGKTYATDFSKAGVSLSTLHNECWKSGVFYMCDQIVDGESKDLILFSFDTKSGAYNNYAIGAEGGPPDFGSLKIEGDTWTYGDPPGATEKGPRFRTINVFEKPNVIRYRSEYTRDGQKWITMSEGLETKQE